ncbi:hypothetical protein RCC89_08010 [Cytophagaceae bacterium ABcell3]|nr:hypothetical protein RCC89_08010 [Cytophagaceae bacterium ABcell3]
MKNVAEIHVENLELTSESKFLMQEIDFFLKLLKKSYLHTKDRDRIKILDAYWKEFEAYKGILGGLVAKVNTRERDISILLRDDLADIEETKLKEGDENTIFYQVLRGIRVLKESFYTYMSENSEECSCS